jgi:hypothetical protein
MNTRSLIAIKCPPRCGMIKGLGADYFNIATFRIVNIPHLPPRPFKIQQTFFFKLKSLDVS